MSFEIYCGGCGCIWGATEAEAKEIVSSQLPCDNCGKKALTTNYKVERVKL